MNDIVVEKDRRTWSGGEYEGREGIEIVADEHGVTLTAWYDGGIGLSIEGRLTWDELAELRTEQESPQ